MEPTNQLQLVVYVPQEVCPQELSSTTSIVLGVPPLSAYEIDLMKPFVKDLELQINIYKQELKELEEPKDPEHMFAMVAFEDVANKVEKKRGRTLDQYQFTLNFLINISAMMKSKGCLQLDSLLSFLRLKEQ
ncbi:hypothetical protein QL285_036849 [Trifolium repens]|nr:hypothetical protein QL285_036849 [Trifolium repens]